tara:strand:+ start:62 stop:514 length:453 start_codon:yes stop_codon:yes gene_type:complete
MATKKGGLRTTSRRAYEGLKRRGRSTRQTALYKRLEKGKLAAERRARLANRKLKESGFDTKTTAMIASGGAIAGVVNVYQPNVPGTRIQTSLAVGVGLLAYGLLDFKGPMKKEAILVGNGMLTKYIGDYTEGVAATGFTQFNPTKLWQVT